MLDFTHIRYGIAIVLTAMLAPGMGSTHAAKESVSLIAQLSGGAFFVSGVAVFCLVLLKLFAQAGKLSVLPAHRCQEVYSWATVGIAAA